MSDEPERDDGGPAFPSPAIYGLDGCGISEGWGGLSLRDWFAGQYISGASGHPDFVMNDEQYLAREAYKVADAMLEARKK